jgi:hypothetical protein
MLNPQMKAGASSNLRAVPAEKNYASRDCPVRPRSKSAAAEAQPFLGRVHPLLLTVIEQLEGL